MTKRYHEHNTGETVEHWLTCYPSQQASKEADRLPLEDKRFFSRESSNTSLNAFHPVRVKPIPSAHRRQGAGALKKSDISSLGSQHSSDTGV